MSVGRWRRRPRLHHQNRGAGGIGARGEGRAQRLDARQPPRRSRPASRTAPAIIAVAMGTIPGRRHFQPTQAAGSSKGCSHGPKIVN